MMKQFMMIFRSDKDAPKPDPKDLPAIIEAWQNWSGGIAAQGKFVATDALGFEGKLIKPSGVMTDGPYAEVKEVVGGYAIVKADNLEDAIKLTEGCPMFDAGGTVEVRDVMVFDV